MGIVRAGSLPPASSAGSVQQLHLQEGVIIALAIALWAGMCSSFHRHLIKKQTKGELTGAKTKQIDW